MEKLNKSNDFNFFSVNVINLIFIAVGILLILSARLPYGYKWGENVLDGIGCSCISAAIMSFFMNQLQMNKYLKNAELTRKLYFKNLYDSLGEMLQRILWFDKRWGEKDFDWNLPINEYGSLKFMLLSYEQNKSEEKLSFNELKNRIDLCSAKYTLEKVKDLNNEDWLKLQNMIKIILFNSMDVLNQKNRIDFDKFQLSEMASLDLNEINEIIKHIDFAFYIFLSDEKKAFGTGYKLILQSLCKLKDLCGFDNEFTITPKSSIKIGEL